MKKFNVTIQRSEFREHTFLVEARNKYHAEEVAMEESCDYDFGLSTVSSAGEEVIAVWEEEV